MRFVSIKFKTALIATMLFLSMVSLIVALQVWYLHKSVQELLSAQQFSLVKASALDLDQKLRVRVAALGNVANEIPEAVKRDPAALRKLLKERPALKALFNRVFIFSHTGAILAAAPELPGAEKLNVSDRAYFRSTMAKRKSVISDPYLGRINNQPAVMVTAPIFDAGGAMVAMMGGTFDLLGTNMLGEIGSDKIGETGYFYMIAKGPPAILVAHPDKTRIMTAVPAVARNPSLARALAGFEGSLLGVNSAGLEGLFSFKSLQAAPWLLVAVLPTKEAFAPIEDLIKKTILIALGVSLLVAPLIWLVVYELLAPLQTLGANMRTLHEHGYKDDTELPVARNDEIGVLTAEFNALMRARREAEQQLDHIAKHDGLTGLPNRVLFLDRLQQALLRGARSGKPLGLMYLDIDHFKQINDSLGHAAGDALLKAFAQMLGHCVRATDTVARLGGDEFVVLLENLQNLANAEAIAQKIVANAHAMPHAGSISTSLGLAYLEKVGKCDPSEIIERADAAMYEAKQAGRNRYVVARDSAGEGPAAANSES